MYSPHSFSWKKGKSRASQGSKSYRGPLKHYKPMDSKVKARFANLFAKFHKRALSHLDTYLGELAFGNLRPVRKQKKMHSDESKTDKSAWESEIHLGDCSNRNRLIYECIFGNVFTCFGKIQCLHFCVLASEDEILTSHELFLNGYRIQKLLHRNLFLLQVHVLSREPMGTCASKSILQRPC